MEFGRRSILLCCLFQFTAGSALGQNDEIDRYLPLAVGNTWQFHNDTTVTALKTTIVNDTTYFVLDNLWLFQADTLRSDIDGNIWAREQGRDFLLFDFDTEDGESYELPCDYDWCDGHFVTAEYHDELEQHGQTFKDVLSLYFDIRPGADDERRMYFAPGLGPIRITSVWIYYTLTSVVINGEYESVSRGEITIPVAPEPSVYPNPFTSSSTISVPRGGTSCPSLQIVDVQGRIVANLMPDACSTDSCTFEVRGSSMSPGVYFLHVQAESYSSSMSVIYLH